MDADLSRKFSLAGKVVVITGAGSGIGQGMADTLSSAGAAIVAADIDEAGLAETIARVEASGGSIKSRRTDVGDRADVESLADFVVDAFGQIDVWVNSAAILIYQPIIDADSEDVRRMLDVNLAGTYWCCAAAARRMVPKGSGSIINLSSTGADAPVPGLSLYSLTKAAVNMLTRTAAMEFGPSGIRVNAIAPGFVDTPMVTYRFRDEAGRIDPVAREALLQDRAKGSPLGVTGTTQDIGLAALYLASDASRIVTGQILRVNGGVSMP